MQDIFRTGLPERGLPRDSGPARRHRFSFASDKDDSTVDPRFGKVGKQVILSDKMWKEEEIAYFDDKVSKRAQSFMQRQVKANKPFFVMGQLHPHAPLD